VRAIILETAVAHIHLAQLIDYSSYMKKVLYTNEVVSSLNGTRIFSLRYLNQAVTRSACVQLRFLGLSIDAEGVGDPIKLDP